MPSGRLSKVKLNSPHVVFLKWAIMAGLALFGVYLVWHQGLLQRVLEQDNTRICLVILLLCAVGSALAGLRSMYLSRQVEQFRQIQQQILQSGWSSLSQSPLFATGQSICLDYLQYQNPKAHPSESQLLAEVMGERARGNHQVGWFITGLMVKLGLLGTVVGFILMLSTVEGLATVDLSDIKNLMQQMTQGMGIAMNTTLVGLVASMVLGAQYLLLDRSADKLVADTVQFAHQANPAARQA